MGIALSEWTPVDRIAFVTQHASALDSRWPRPILGDTLAAEIVAKIDDDFEATGGPAGIPAGTGIGFSAVETQWAYRCFTDRHVPESWSPRLRLVEETSLSHAPEIDLYPVAARVSTRLMGMTKSGARTARILRYRF